jgi:hypothetical protein
LILLIPSYAYAQEVAVIDYDKCEYDMINDNVYAPFYFHINHEQAISQVFKQKHDDNPNVSPFQRSPDITIPDEYPTWFEFGSSVNATATYEFQLELGYKEDVDYARPITIQLFSENTLMMEKKIYQEDKIGCIAFKVYATAPPHVFTYEEILEIAKSEFVGTTKQFTLEIDENTSKLESLSNNVIVLGLIFAIVVIYLILNDRSRSRALQTLKEEYDIRNDLLETSLIKQDANLKFAHLQMTEQKVAVDSMISTMINNFGHMIASMQVGIKDIKFDFKTFIDQLREESSIPEPVKIIPEVMFVDIEKHDSSDECTMTPKPVIESKVETVKDVDDSKLSQLMNIFNIKKKEEPVLSDIDKLKIKWSEMKNPELLKLYTEYASKSEEYMKRTGKHSVEYDYAVMILSILNSRDTDVEDG